MSTTESEIMRQAKDLINGSGFPVTPAELERLEVNDFGLGHPEKEGFAFIDILRSPRLRITLLVLLPGQTLPQHVHPRYEGEVGKEETLRVLYGATRVYIKGGGCVGPINIPADKDPYYTARTEIALQPGEQFTVEPETEHWFQGGPEGSVNICFQNRVDENRNIFFDPQSTGCPINPPQ